MWKIKKGDATKTAHYLPHHRFQWYFAAQVRRLSTFSISKDPQRPLCSNIQYDTLSFGTRDRQRLSHLSAIKAEPVIHHLISTCLFSISGPRKLQLFVQAAGVIEFAAEMAGSKISFSARMSVGEARADRRPLSLNLSPLSPILPLCSALDWVPPLVFFSRSPSLNPSLCLQGTLCWWGTDWIPFLSVFVQILVLW